MSNTNRLKYIFTLFVFLNGCVVPQLVKPIRVNVKNVDVAWTAVNQTLIELGLDIESSDKESLILTTSWSADYHVTLSNKGENGYSECRYVIKFDDQFSNVILQCRLTELILVKKIRLLPPSETYASELQQQHLKEIKSSILRSQN